MTEPDDKLRERYRRLGHEEPPPALDAAILASARRAVSTRPAMRWSGPVSIAAVLMLAVGVTLRMRQEEPGIETSMPSEYAAPAPAAPQAPPTPAPQFEESRKALDATREAAPRAAPKPGADKARARDQARPRTEPERKDAPPVEAQVKQEAQAFADKPEKLSVAPAEAPAAAAAVPEPPATPPSGARADAMERSAANVGSFEARAKRAPPAAIAPTTVAPSAQSSLAKKEVPPDPLVRELERIATLRREGRHAEADKALEEFRRANPAYRIPYPLWEQVKPR
jgi:hypothetical protein